MCVDVGRGGRRSGDGMMPVAVGDEVVTRPVILGKIFGVGGRGRGRRGAPVTTVIRGSWSAREAAAGGDVPESLFDFGVFWRRETCVPQYFCLLMERGEASVIIVAFCNFVCDVPRQSGDDDAQKSLKRGQEVETGAQHNVSGGGHLFVDGVNRRDRAGSFWDLSDPDLREERSRNSESKLHEEIAMFHEELLKKQKESDEKSKSSDTLRVELEEKSKSYEILWQELQQLEEKYSVELTTGEHFLNSAMGKTLLTSTMEKAIEGYRASSSFRDEVLQQALTIHDQVVIDCRRQVLRETELVSEDTFVNDRA
ncbi:hypothetical protein F511_32531 [Dorcoceras hygrometricum]|uniref:Uncharacterized protein n=1 Tax=Dorcoceras hygrometricum TaxID=472368 RepID=A0A2Z7CAX0_9LAMI|nr:hypothetical protein F511_32531 [Dorcoceras hygrometricum]